MKKAKNTQTELQVDEILPEEPVAIEPEKTVVADIPTAEPTVIKKKKRIRDRRKAVKKLSAAILCANPNIKRFA